MEPGVFAVTQIRIVGDTMWNTLTVNQNGPVANPQTGRYVRVRGAADPLRGAWSQLDRVAVDDGRLLNNQPGFRLYVDGYHAFIRVNGTEPRAPFVDSTATVEDLVAAWGPAFTASSGTYEVAGDSVIERNVVAKNPDGMAPDSYAVNRLDRAGDTLRLTGVGGSAGPTPIANQGTGRYVRVGRPAIAN
jgi:hypothetical protein